MAASSDPEIGSHGVRFAPSRTQLRPGRALSELPFVPAELPFVPALAPLTRQVVQAAAALGPSGRRPPRTGCLSRPAPAGHLQPLFLLRNPYSSRWASCNLLFNGPFGAVDYGWPSSICTDGGLEAPMGVSGIFCQ